MIITHKLQPMDLTHKQNTIRVDVVQDDKYSRDVEFTFTENGVAWQIPDGATAVVRYKKPDGTGGNYDTLPDGSTAYQINGNVLTVALAPQVCTVPGQVQLSVGLIHGNAEINTFSVNIIVQPNPGSTYQSEDYIKLSGAVPNSGWTPNMYLGTDASGNVVAKEGTSGGGETVSVDSTLTQSGQAADAAVVGQRLGELSEEIITTSESKVAAHNTGTDTHSDIRVLIQGLTDRLNALADSDDTTLDQLSEVVAYIKSNRTLIEAITTSKVSVADIIDNLTTNVTNKPLSAAQGVALKALIDAITIPGSLPNPNALTFTGAVTGSYDGSEPLTVEIPSGGSGGSDAWNLIDHFTVSDAAISYAINLQPGAKEYGIYWKYKNDKTPRRNIYVDGSLADFGVMYRCTNNETLFLRVFKGPSNILVTGQGVGYAAQRFSNGGTNIGSGTDFPAMTLTTDITCETSEIWVYWR